jgi:hypothetical protein
MFVVVVGLFVCLQCYYFENLFELNSCVQRIGDGVCSWKKLQQVEAQ